MEIKQQIIEQWTKVEITKEVKMYLQTNENQYTTYQNFGMQ